MCENRPMEWIIEMQPRELKNKQILLWNIKLTHV